MPESEHPAHRRVREAALRKGVEIEIVTFPESTHTALDAAHALGAELGQIVKSLVFADTAMRGVFGLGHGRESSTRHAADRLRWRPP